MIIELQCADDSDSSKLEYVVGPDFKNGAWQVSQTVDDVPSWVFSSNESTTKWYQQDKPEITEFDIRMFVILQIDLAKNDDGSFSINLSGKLTSDETQLSKALDRLSSSKWLSTLKGLKEAIVVRKLQDGLFLESVSSSDEKTTCRWLQPEFSEPGCLKSDWEFIGDSELRMISADSQIQIRAFTSTKSNGLTEMKWPRVKTVKREVNLDLTVELMSRLRKTIDGSKDVEKVADQNDNQFKPAKRR